MVCVFLPAESDIFMFRVLWHCSRFKIGHIEIGKRVVDEAVHGPGLAEHVLIDQSRDKIRCEGDHKGLKKGRDRQNEKMTQNTTLSDRF